MNISWKHLIAVLTAFLSVALGPVWSASAQTEAVRGVTPVEGRNYRIVKGDDAASTYVYMMSQTDNVDASRLAGIFGATMYDLRSDNPKKTLAVCWMPGHRATKNPVLKTPEDRASNFVWDHADLKPDGAPCPDAYRHVVIVPGETLVLTGKKYEPYVSSSERLATLVRCQTVDCAVENARKLGAPIPLTSSLTPTAPPKADAPVAQAPVPPTPQAPAAQTSLPSDREEIAKLKKELNDLRSAPPKSLSADIAMITKLQKDLAVSRLALKKFQDTPVAAPKPVPPQANAALVAQLTQERNSARKLAKHNGVTFQLSLILMFALVVMWLISIRKNLTVDQRVDAERMKWETYVAKLTSEHSSSLQEVSRSAAAAESRLTATVSDLNLEVQSLQLQLKNKGQELLDKEQELTTTQEALVAVESSLAHAQGRIDATRQAIINTFTEIATQLGFPMQLPEVPENEEPVKYLEPLVLDHLVNAGYVFKMACSDLHRTLGPPYHSESKNPFNLAPLWDATSALKEISEKLKPYCNSSAITLMERVDEIANGSLQRTLESARSATAEALKNVDKIVAEKVRLVVQLAEIQREYAAIAESHPELQQQLMEAQREIAALKAGAPHDSNAPVRRRMQTVLPGFGAPPPANVPNSNPQIEVHNLGVDSEEDENNSLIFSLKRFLPIAEEKWTKPLEARSPLEVSYLGRFLTALSQLKVRTSFDGQSGVASVLELTSPDMIARFTSMDPAYTH